MCRNGTPRSSTSVFNPFSQSSFAAHPPEMPDPTTIASYRDTFKMLLQFVHKRLGKAPAALVLDDIDAPLVMTFSNQFLKPTSFSSVK